MKELQNRWLLRTTSYFVLTACFTLLCLLGLSAVNLQRVLTLWGDDIQITAYLASDAPDSARADLEKVLAADRRIDRFEWIPREKALKTFEAQMASYAPDLLGDQDVLSLIPPSFQISLSPELLRGRQGEVLEKVAALLRGQPGVEEVRYGQEWVKKYAAVVTMAERGLFGLGVLFIVVSFFVISNVLRASMESRRGEIEVLELIGASSWMIRKPLVVEGVLLGGVASLTALGVSMGVFSAAQQLLKTELNSLQLAQHVGFLSVSAALALVLIGPFVGGLASYLAARRLNSGWAACRSMET